MTRGPDTAALDAAADAAGLDEGLIDVSDHESVALASTLEAAARAHGSPVVTVDGWIVVQGTGRHLMSWQTPKGRKVWTQIGFLSPVPCPSADASPTAND